MDIGQGLSAAEARARLEADGPNEMPGSEGRSALSIAAEVLREPMLLLLLGAGALYLVLGDLKEALILLGFSVLSIVITIIQETRTERVLDALRALAKPRARVIRDGRHREVAIAEIVRGDLVVLEEGERVPADGLLMHSRDLSIDESLLTGESVPVGKTVSSVAAGTAPRPGGEDQPWVFSGSLVVRGSGVAEVSATGPRSEIGRIGQALGSLDREPPRLRAQTNRVVRIFALAGAVVSAATVLLYGLFRGDWLQAALAGIAIGMSMLPEEFPVVLTVFMAMGAWRISRAQVLTRRAAAIETLGSATVLCTDKTGTLTENRMRIAQLVLPSGEVFDCARRVETLPDGFATLASFGSLASAVHPVDPMEKAFHELARTGDSDADAGELVQVFGLRPDLLAVTQMWRRPGLAGLVVATKGAPEAVARLCRLDDAAQVRLGRDVDALANDGMRVLGVAGAKWPADTLPASPQACEFEFLGLVGLADPLRSGVRAAVEECRTAGIRVIMVTGDYPATARTVAGRAGIAAETVLSGRDIASMTSAELRAEVARTSVFARLWPEQKLEIVEALKANGEVVAMTGDGVNDAPSLKAAHIGVAMGGRGTDVAREAASVVLIDDDFTSIVKAVRLGRRIYDNLRKAIGFIFAAHIPIAALALMPLIAGLPPLLGPIHIAFLEMIIDPVCSLVFEAEHAERNVMRRPPRRPDEPLFSRALVVWGGVQGLAATLVVAGVFAVASTRGMPETELRAICYFALVTSLVALILVNRSYGASLIDAVARPSGALIVVMVGVSGILTASLLVPAASDLFRFGPLHADDLGIVGAGAFVMLLVLEGLKLLLRPEKETA